MAQKIVYLLGDFGNAVLRTKNAVGFESKVDNSGFGDGKMHPVDVGRTRYVFCKPTDDMLKMKRGKPDVHVYADPAGQTFVLRGDGQYDVNPAP